MIKEHEKTNKAKEKGYHLSANIVFVLYAIIYLLAFRATRIFEKIKIEYNSGIISPKYRLKSDVNDTCQ